MKRQVGVQYFEPLLVFSLIHSFINFSYFSLSHTAHCLIFIEVAIDFN